MPESNDYLIVGHIVTSLQAISVAAGYNFTARTVERDLKQINEIAALNADGTEATPYFGVGAAEELPWEHDPGRIVYRTLIVDVVGAYSTEVAANLTLAWRELVCGQLERDIKVAMTDGANFLRGGQAISTRHVSTPVRDVSQPLEAVGELRRLVAFVHTRWACRWYESLSEH